MPPKAKAKKASGGAGALSASESSSNGLAEAAKEMQQELRLWDKFTSAVKLIKTQSEVYHAAEEGAEKGKVFVYPIIAAFGQQIGAADPSEEVMDKRMRLVELLAVVDRAPEPDAMSVFTLRSEKLGLCPALLGQCTSQEKKNLTPLLERMHDIGEYLQLDKRLCARIKQLMAAHRLFTGRIFLADIKEDKDVGPLLQATMDRLAATPIPAVLATVAPSDRQSRELLNLPQLLGQDAVLQAALGWTSAEFGGNLEWSPSTLTTAQLFFAFGQALAGRTIAPGVLEALACTEMGPGLERIATRILEALVVLGRGQAALQLFEEGELPEPRYLCKSGDALVVKGA